MKNQNTIKSEVSLQGIGIHTGEKVKVTFKPAPIDSGINFIRVDLPEKPAICANIPNVLEASLRIRRTAIGKENAQVHTIEHFMASFSGLGIDNINVEIDGPETPGLDGSAKEIVAALKKAGISQQQAQRRELSIKEPIYVEQKDCALVILPSEDFSVSYTLDYAHPGLGYQHNHFAITPEVFENEIAPSRTFCLKKEAQLLQKQNLGKGASLDNTIVIDEKGDPSVKLRFSDEFLRHKILDVIGDLFLSGHFLKAHVMGIKSGHFLNLKMAHRIITRYPKGIKGAMAPLLDKEAIKKILPHREPFLMVDEMIDLGQATAVGIKYVDKSEYYFQGHFPGRPIMPGVLILEALAQVGGVLMLNKIENRGKLAYFMCIDNVKFRKTVVPGDKLRLEIEVTRLRTKAGQVHGKAFVGDGLVCEADLMFSLVE